MTHWHVVLDGDGKVGGAFVQPGPSAQALSPLIQATEMPTPRHRAHPCHPPRSSIGWTIFALIVK